MKYNGNRAVINNENIKGEYTDKTEGKGSSHVFRKSKTVFSTEDIKRKAVTTKNKVRQNHFENQLRLLSGELGSNIIPVFFILNGHELRLDQGCIGHAAANGVIDEPANNSEAFVDCVTLK
jgi:hypothetical protein